jgi:hypothetical protein
MIFVALVGVPWCWLMKYQVCGGHLDGDFIGIRHQSVRFQYNYSREERG